MKLQTTDDLRDKRKLRSTAVRLYKLKFSRIAGGNFEPIMSLLFRQALAICFLFFLHYSRHIQGI